MTTIATEETISGTEEMDRGQHEPPDHSLSVRQASGLIELVYQGMVETIPWSSMLWQLRGLMGASWVSLIVRPPSDCSAARIVNAGPNGVAMGGADWSSLAVFAIDPMVNLPEGRMVLVEEIIGEERWLECEFYKMLVEPYDIRWIMGADLRTSDRAECRLRICRSPNARRFSEADRKTAELLLPHLRRAVELNTRLTRMDSERQLFGTTVDRMLIGTVLLDESGMVLRTNSVADEILAEEGGLALVRGGLQASYPSEDKELQRMIRQALAGVSRSAQAVGQAMSITRPTGRSRLSIAVRALPLSEFAEGKRWPAVSVFLRDPDRKAQGSVEMLRKLYGLTPAESMLTMQLVEGLTLDEAAEQLHVRKNTARAHLRSIFSKTNVTRQTSLVSLLMGSLGTLQ